jgi:predicted nucleic acid-binding protein
VTDAPALLDTSVLIARDSGRSLDVGSVPDQTAVSVVTLAELHAGVLAAPDTSTRARRLATLDAVSVVSALPVTAEAARHWAALRVRLAEEGRAAKVNDLWIAAIAAANKMDIVSQDGDFDAIETVGGPHVIRV